MAILKDLHPTGRKGVFYRDHETRKNGIKKDRLLILRFTIDGKTRTETFGWTSEGKSEIDAEKKIADFKSNARSGLGPVSLADEKSIKDAAAAVLAATQKAEERKNLTFEAFWTEHYWPDCQRNKKKGSVQAEYHLHEKWIAPILDKLKLIEITPFHLRAIRKKMETAGRATATIKYAFAVVSQVWSMARSDGYVQGDCPTKDKTCKLPTLNNGKERYLTVEEVAKLLPALRQHSNDLADIAMLSLHTGLRAGEIFKLKWADVNLTQNTLRLWDTKTGNNRSVPLTEDAGNMLRTRYIQGNGFVFTARDGSQIHSVSRTFRRCVEEIGLNEGITDKRNRLTFHGLRHSAASFMVQAGETLQTVGEILGHSTIRMTQRYSHLAPTNLKNGVAKIGQALAGVESKKNEQLTDDFLGAVNQKS